MRKALFTASAWISFQAIRALTWASHWSLAVQIWIVSWLKKGIAGLGVLAMKLVDAKRFEYVNREAEDVQAAQIASAELRLMSTAVKLRDHAIDSGDWTEHHTDALNAVGEALLNEAGWEEIAVHKYLKGVVESIEGLEYDEDG